MATRKPSAPPSHAFAHTRRRFTTASGKQGQFYSLPELAKTDGYKGVTGTIGFDAKGDIKNGALTLFTYKDGKREQIAVVR